MVRFQSSKNVFAERHNMHRHRNSRNCSMDVRVDNQRQKDYKAEVLLSDLAVSLSG